MRSEGLLRRVSNAEVRKKNQEARIKSQERGNKKSECGPKDSFGECRMRNLLSMLEFYELKNFRIQKRLFEPDILEAAGCKILVNESRSRPGRTHCFALCIYYGCSAA
jgi:hypothetical protein